MNTRIEGKKGEDLAAEYLVHQGYKILERNYSCPFGEIDIVACEKKFIVFVEVKARRSFSFGMPREAVNWSKQQKIIKSSASWLYDKKKTGAPARFDVVEVNGPDSIVLIRDAFRP